MQINIEKNWHKVDTDNTQEVHLDNGVKVRVRKHYDENCEHSKFKGQGEWDVEVLENGSEDWEWVDTYSPMFWAKESALAFAGVK